MKTLYLAWGEKIVEAYVQYHKDKQIKEISYQ